MMRIPAAKRAVCSSSCLLSTTRPVARSQTMLTQSLRPLVAARHESTTKSGDGHAISNPTLANIEKRWEQMPPQEQAELWMALRDRMTANWHDLTMQEKKASYWIAFGPHGPRKPTDPNEKYEVMKIVALALLASTAIFGLTRYFAGPAPRTMTKEYQELTNEYLKAQRVEPITGISSEGYTGPGMIQSKPSGIKPGEEEEEE